MNPGTVQRNSATGTIGRNPLTGKIWRNTSTSSTCCCIGSCKCSELDSLGDTLVAVIADIAIPSDCMVMIGGCSVVGFCDTIQFKFISAPVNGTFCLTRVDGTCTFTAIIPQETDFYCTRDLVCAGYGPILRNTDPIQVIATVGWDSMAGAATVRTDLYLPFGLVRDAFGLVPRTVFSSDPQPLACGDNATLTNKSVWYGPRIGELVGAVILGDDLTTIYPAPPFSAPPGFIDGGWPPPSTPFDGTVKIYDAAC